MYNIYFLLKFSRCGFYSGAFNPEMTVCSKSVSCGLGGVRGASTWDTAGTYLFEAEKWNRTTYWDYSLSWYNLAGEKAKWWDQERRKKRKERKKETVLHPSKYILQTTKHFSEATIRGQALSQDHPFPSAGPSTLALISTEEQQKANPHWYHKDSVIWSRNMQI